MMIKKLKVQLWKFRLEREVRVETNTELFGKENTKKAKDPSLSKVFLCLVVTIILFTLMVIDDYFDLDIVDKIENIFFMLDKLSILFN